MDKKRALSVAETARYAGVSRGTVEVWLMDGLLPYEELPGRGKGNYRFRRIRSADLDTFLDRHYHQTGHKNNHRSKQDLVLLPREQKHPLVKP